MASTQISQPNISILYSLFFKYLDPLICIWGAYMDFFDPALVLSSHVPNPSPDIGHAMILRQRGGGMLNFGFISYFLLRYTGDMKIWRIVQMADLIVDVAYFWAVWGVLDSQGRLGMETWRAEDWGSIGITGTATVVRVMFLAGIGCEKERGLRKSA